MPSLAKFFSVVIYLFASFGAIVSEIHDPLNIFCGSASCYDVLDVQRNATVRDIKKSYRKLSLTHHPDKNKEDNATEVFRVISKAYDVLTGNESRPLFDYYLDNPRDYFKVSGQHYMRNMPKSDARVVIFFALLLISWFFRHIQYSKYQKAVKFLTNAASQDLPLKSGGTKQTIELHKRATELYEAHLKEAKEKPVGKMKMLKDPLFLKFIDKVVSEVKIEGGYRKPEWNEFLLIQLVYLPSTLYKFAQKYHRRYISKEPLPREDQVEMARDRIGLGSWEELSESEREEFIAMRIWEESVYNRYVEEREAKLEKRMAKKGVKAGRGRKQRGDEEDETEGDN